MRCLLDPDPHEGCWSGNRKRFMSLSITSKIIKNVNISLSFFYLLRITIFFKWKKFLLNLFTIRVRIRIQMKADVGSHYNVQYVHCTVCGTETMICCETYNLFHFKTRKGACSGTLLCIQLTLYCITLLNNLRNLL